MKRKLTAAAAVLCLAVLAALLLRFTMKGKPKVTLTFKMPTLATKCVNDPQVREAYDIFGKATADFAAQYKEAEVTFKLVKFDLADESHFIPECFGTADAADLSPYYPAVPTAIPLGEPYPPSAIWAGARSRPKPCAPPSGPAATTRSGKRSSAASGPRQTPLSLRSHHQPKQNRAAERPGFV